MDIVLTPIQHDRLVDALLDTSLATRGRARLACASGIPLARVETAWRQLCLAVPALRLRVESGPNDASGASMEGGESGLPRVTVGTEIPPVERATPTSAGHGSAPGPRRPMCALTAEASAGTVTGLVLDYGHLALDDRGADLVLREVERLARSGAVRALTPSTPHVTAPSTPHATAHSTTHTATSPTAPPPRLHGLDGLDAPDAPAARDYWRTALDGLDAATTLFDETRKVPDPCARATKELDPRLSEAVDRAAAEREMPRSWLVLLAWAVVVARFRGGEPSAVGVLLDTRPPGLEDAIGVYEAALPLVVGLDRAPMDTWLTERAAELRRLVAHAHLSRAERNELSGRSRTVDLFDTVFDLRPDGLLPDADGAHRYPGPPVACTLRLDGDTLIAVHDEAIVVDDLAARLLDCVTVALAALTSGEGTTAELSLLGPMDHSAVRRHNGTAAAYPADRCLHHLVEEQAARTPDAVALVHEGETMTYARMNRRANRLAHELIARGVRPDSVVGLCAEPGFALCVGILGILKAGAAYAPLDPFFPPDRLDYLYRDLDCPVVLVEERLTPLLPVDEARNLVLDPPDAFAGRPEDDPDVDVNAANLAYVMYTSGSTGRPKGVLIEHGGAVNFLWWMRERFELRPDQAALQWTAYSFDAAVWELFWPLVVGARAVIAPGKIHLDIERFVDLIADNSIATLHFVPAMLQTFLSAPDVERCTALSHVFVSGEPVPVSLLRRFCRRLDADLINLYGVTEVSIDSTYYVCPREEELPFVRSGTPLSNTETYVLDENLQPVPFGARGEVFIAGDSVTRGYLGRRGLTAYRFVPDPFRGRGARMYRTGDVAQLLPDGHLRFLGRADHQVKIRGIRIELLEVAAELNAFPAVRESLVVPFGEGADRALAAYVVAEEGAELDVAELRAFAAGLMPPYMVPSAIVVLDAFPLNSNGKVDHRALPDPADRFALRSAGRAPSGPVEERIAAIWRRLLGLETVGADEEFFSIGGNSLLATQVIAEVRRAFSTQLSLREWLEAGTVAQLAQAVERHRGERESAAAVLDEVESSGSAGSVGSPGRAGSLGSAGSAGSLESAGSLGSVVESHVG